MTIHFCVVVSALVAVMAGISQAAAAEAKTQGTNAAPVAKPFPLRSQYIDVAVLTTEELAAKFEQSIVVDVRSQYEYDTLRIKNAVLIPVTDKDFVDQVKRLRQNSAKPIVFYCNGVTCRKSYDAVLKTENARITGTYCYDAGIFAWAKAHPERAVLLGVTPVKVENLIDDKKFKDHLLAPKEFAARIGASTLVLDLRDRAQRDTPLFPFKEQRAQLDETAKIDAIIERAKTERKTLLVYDAVGKQVQWVQYYFEGRGIKDYYFMKDGAQGYWDATLGKVVFGNSK